MVAPKQRQPLQTIAVADLKKKKEPAFPPRPAVVQPQAHPVQPSYQAKPAPHQPQTQSDLAFAASYQKEFRPDLEKPPGIFNITSRGNFPNIIFSSEVSITQ